MKVYRGFLDLQPDLQAPAVSIGNFDGVHRGHQAVIESAVTAARCDDRPAVVCTFDPHTRVVLEPESPPRLLITLGQRLAAVAELGIDSAVVIPFDRHVAATPKEEFVAAFLRDTLHASSVHVSQGFTFGRGGAGDVHYLQRVAREHGFTVTLVPPVVEDGAPISSTRVRQAVKDGDVAGAARLLGRPFALVGEVVRGVGRGADLDAPTANLEVSNGCLPATGVYVTEAILDGRSHPAVANVGMRPTFESGNELTVEAHLLDFDGRLYGARMELAFHERIRDEKAFTRPRELVQQIRRDVDFASRWFARHGAVGDRGSGPE